MDIYLRFWNKVDKAPGHGPRGDCWLWTACKDRYGFFSFNGRMQSAHRVAYQIHTGKSIPAGMLVLHSCDNPPCVNPAHLSLGTQQDNQNQMVARGRQAVGEHNGNTKLTEDHVREIRGWWTTGDATQVSLARVYGVSRVQIGSIIHRKVWRHV